MANIYLAQMKPTLYDKKANLQKMLSFIKKAAAKKADLILFPEMALTGYHTRNKTRSLSETLDGTSIRQVRKWAALYRMKVVFGFPEMMKGSIYNSACFINDNGEILGSYQKVHLWDEEYKYFTAGESFPVWETNIGKIGIMICYDTEFPETARLLTLKGAEIVLAPTANMTPFEERQKIQVQCRAGENQIFVASTNRVGTEESTFFFGESIGAGPFGDLITLGDRTENGYLMKCDLKQIEESKKVFDYLQDRRPQMYHDL